MNNIVTIKINPDQHSELGIHPDKAVALELRSRKYACLSFGNRKQYVKIKMNPEISPEHLILSPNLIEGLHLPDYPVYEINIIHNEIVIGPYIGLLVSNEERKLTSSRLNKMLVYVKEYAKLHGAVVVFALNQVDQKNRLIEGYCFHPGRGCWQRGIFPYPASIYRTIGLSPEWKNHFLAALGERIFNSRFFNKWEMIQWFSKEPAIAPYLPETVLYQAPEDLLEMIQRFSKIYIKPILGLQGRGIFRLCVENQRLILEYRERGGNRRTIFPDQGQVVKYLGERLRPGRYLVQQAIDLLEYKGGLIDFRCVVQKNQANQWICQAIIGRSGVKESIVSNISSGGAAFTAENILRKAMPGSEAVVAETQNKIAALALKVCNQLDEYGINLGTLGLDIGLDSQGRLWLIEINNRDPDPGIALDIRDTQLYYTLKTGPLFYAKFLAGFTEES
ncbi:MAG TPA: YheC/YheD family protein [Bacillota bacterium]|nr:YheC/YheD family protein [Bacillota bacterium]